MFEVKNYSGWIFGNGRQQQWTQVLNYGQEKHRFYNPILQNNKHIEDLRARLCHLGNFPFFSVIVFSGNCELRNISIVPPGTYITSTRRVVEVINTIFNENNDAYYSNKWEVVRILRGYEAAGKDNAVKDRHIENVKEMLGSERVFD